MLPSPENSPLASRGVTWRVAALVTLCYTLWPSDMAGFAKMTHKTLRAFIITRAPRPLYWELYLAVLVQESHYRITNLFKFLCTEIWSPIPSAGSWKLLGSDTNARDYFDKTVPNWVLEIDAREFLGSPRVLRADLILNFRDDDNDTFPWACNWRVLYLQREIR